MSLIFLILLGLVLATSEVTNQNQTVNPQYNPLIPLPHEQRKIINIEFLYRTYHFGKACSSHPHMYVIEPAPINVCYPADPMAEQPHIYTCTNPGNLNYQYFLYRKVYGKKDSTCALAPLATQNVMRIKDLRCKKDIDSGNYLLAQCGTILPELGGDQLIVKSYTSLECEGGRSLYGSGIVKSTLLDGCAPVYFPPSSGFKKDQVAYYRKLALVPGTVEPTVVVIEEQRFDSSDPRCKTTPTATKRVKFDTSSEKSRVCKSDPLYTDMSYSHAMLVRKGQLATLKAPFWMLYP